MDDSPLYLVWPWYICINLFWLVQWVLQGCPIGHICVTTVIINCSCLRVFHKGFWGSTTKAFKQASIGKFIGSNLHSFSTFMGSYSALAWLCPTGRAHTGSVKQQQLLGEHYTLDQTWIMGSLQWVYHWLIGSLAHWLIGSLAHNHLIHPFVLVKHISVFICLTYAFLG